MSDTSNITIGLNEIDNKLDLNSSKDNQNSNLCNVQDLPKSTDSQLPFKATSPLHIKTEKILNKDNEVLIPNINKNNERLSKDDFSYLSSRLSPMPGAWIVPENTNILKYNQQNFNEFIDNDNNINKFETEKYLDVANTNDVQGILEHSKPLSNSLSSDELSDDEFLSVDNNFSNHTVNKTSQTVISPTKGLNLEHSVKEDQTLSDIDYTNNSSSFLNSSIPTQDLKDLILENDPSDLNLPKNDNNNNNNDDDDSLTDNEKTPIVKQKEFSSDLNDTPILQSHLLNNNDLKISSSENNNDNRIQSLSSSLYSELPNSTNDSSNDPSNDTSNRIQSLSSSVYSQIPGRSSIGINEGLRNFRNSNFKPILNKNPSSSLDIENNDNLKIPQRGNKIFKTSNFLNNHESVSENEPLAFTNKNNIKDNPKSIIDSSKIEEEIEKNEKQDFKEEQESKMRVSVLNQSLYQNRYDSTTGEPSNLNISLSTVKKNSDRPLLPSSVSKRSTSNLSLISSILTDDTFVEEEEDASALFVTSMYAFDSNSLESENDSSICLSFDQDEIAFTYNLDDSGWGEVTLLSSLKRGWVPMNYFRSTVTSDLTSNEIQNLSNKDLRETRIPLKLLLKYAGTFLLNPQSKPVYIGGEMRGYTFDVECFNGITDGLRRLLIDTNCISRSNSVVQNQPIVRKMRKKLLRGWADLIAKAKDYMGTIATPKIEYLQLLTFHLLQKAITFLDIWGLEQEKIDDEQQLQSSFENNDNAKTVDKNSFDSINLEIEYLEKPPIASYRINEIYNQLLTYLCLIAGRIDLVEHNSKSFTVVGTILGHINLLINEYFFIIKLLKNTINESESEGNLSRSLSKYGKLASNFSLKNQLNSLDSQMEKLRQLVDELNMYIKIMHDSAIKSTYYEPPKTLDNSVESGNNGLYFYSREGGAVVVCACKMIELSSNLYKILKSVVNFTDELILPSNRKYPNYLRMSITPKEFVKKCTNALATESNIKKQVQNYKKLSMAAADGQSHGAKRASNRYSIFKTGNSNDILLSASGLDILSHVDTESPTSTPFLNHNGFEEQDIMYDYEFNIEDEVIRNNAGDKIIGASFRALIYLLTDESNPPDYFLISTFFLTFRIFSDSTQLLDGLIRRFDVNEHYKEKQCDSSTESKIRSRRKLIVKAFQFWLESYWKPKSDYVLLAPLMNFFNEGMKSFLPIESYQLLGTASKLIGHPPIENVNDKLNYNNNISNQQLIPRKISSKMHKKTLSRMSLGGETHALIGEIEAYNSFLDDIETYDLGEINESKHPDDPHLSANLSLNLELKNSNSNSILLTKQQISTIRTIVLSYRKMLGSHWIYRDRESAFYPLDTTSLIESWWNTSQESWKILNEDLTLLNFNGLEIAKQLTLIEGKMFCSIEVGELLNQNFTTKKLHLNLSPNIQKSILFTNLLSDYVIETILKPGLQMRQRIHAFKCWLKIAISCLYLRNFNSLASIMTSLQSFLITRITKIWEGISEKYEDLFHYLASIIHPNKNYNTYREKLKEFLNTNEQESLDIPTVPYLSLFLQDLTFVVDGNPNYRVNTKSFLDEKLINIDKYFKITEIISDIQTLQISYKDVGELGNVYNDKNTDIVRSETLKNLRSHFNEDNDSSFADMFDIMGVPVLQELILLEIWKVKQTNSRDEDRSWKLSCSIQPREKEGS